MSSPVNGIDSSVTYAIESQIFNKNKNNNIAWSISSNTFTDIKFSTATGDVLGIFNDQTGGPTGASRGLFKLNSTGTLIWSRRFQINIPEFNNYSYATNSIEGENGDIVLCNAIGDKLSFTILNNNASMVKLHKTFAVSLPAGFSFIRSVVSFRNNSLFIAAVSQRFVPVPQQEFSSSLFLVKINYLTGNIERVNHLEATDQVTRTIGPLNNIVYKGALSEIITGKFLNDEEWIIAGKKSYSFFDNNRFYAIKIDSSLAIKNSLIYTASTHSYFSASVETTPYINNDGVIQFASLKDTINIAGTSNSCYFFQTTGDLSIRNQKHLNITQTGLNSNGYKLNAVPFLKLNNQLEIIFHTNGSQNDSVLHIVEVPEGIAESGCRGNAEQFIEVSTADINQLPAPQVNAINSSSISITPHILIFNASIIEDRRFCQQKSICDTIKILGPSKFCLPVDTATFRIVKNPLCMRKTIWNLDTAYMKVMTQSGDSVIHVKFLQPFRGFIKAGFEDCVLKDSIPIEVYGIATVFDAGADTSLCPGKSLVLRATRGYKQYQWQSGELSDSISVSLPGKYRVTAFDSCDNEVSDSVEVFPGPESFDLVFSGKICQFDTAKIPLDLAFTNYSWSPSGKGLIRNGVLHLFPGINTEYIVSTIAFSGCDLKDTLKINVEQCPIYFHMPNAFTPNSDGLNDLFRPSVKGPLLSYKLQVFNRYGEIVFESSSPGIGWDGKYRGIPQASNSFVWICSYQFAGKNSTFTRGSVLLIR